MSVGLNPLAKQQALAEFLEEDKRQVSVRHRQQQALKTPQRCVGPPVQALGHKPVWAQGRRRL